MKRLLTTSALALAVAAASSMTAVAGQTTAGLSAASEVVDNCRITGVTGMAFGSYDPTASGPVDADGSFTFRCMRDANYNLYISGARVMTSPSTGAVLGFELYTDSARTLSWPAASTGVIGTASNNAPIERVVYGRLAPGQDAAAAGDYTRTVIVTVEW